MASIKKNTMAKKLAKMELELCSEYYDGQEYDNDLNKYDLEDLEIIEENSSIGDIECVINDICRWHEIELIVKKLEKEDDCFSKSQMIALISANCLNRGYLKILANGSSNKNFEKILKEHHLWE